MIYAYVVFRSMEGKRLLETAYNQSAWSMRTMDWPCCRNEKLKEEVEELKFLGKYLHIETAILPDNIQWKNLGYGNWNVFFRKII